MAYWHYMQLILAAAASREAFAAEAAASSRDPFFQISAVLLNLVPALEALPSSGPTPNAVGEENAVDDKGY